MNKLKAFTIVEMLMVMTLSLVVMGVGIIAFQIVQKQYYQFKEMQIKQLDIVYLGAKIQSDYQKAEGIWYQENTFYFLNGNDTFAKARFDTSYSVLIQIGRSDTLAIGIKEIKLEFRNDPVFDRTWVDRAVLNLNFNNESVILRFNKQYGASLLMNAFQTKN